MHYLYRYVCILNVFFIHVYGQLSAIKNLINNYQSKDKCLTGMNFSCSRGAENYKLYSYLT